MSFYVDTERSQVGFRRRAMATVAAVVLLGGLWQVMRQALQHFLARSSIGEQSRSLMLLDTLRNLDRSAESFELPILHSRIRGQTGFLLLLDQFPAFQGENHKPTWTILDEAFTVRGNFESVAAFVPEISVPMADRDGDGHCEFLYLDLQGRYGLGLLATLRVKGYSLELVGCARENFLNNAVGCEAKWDKDSGGNRQSLFVKISSPLKNNVGVSTSSQGKFAKYEWTRAGGVLKQKTEHGIDLQDYCPLNQPITLPNGVNLLDFVDNLYPHSETLEHLKPEW